MDEWMNGWMKGRRRRPCELGLTRGPAELDPRKLLPPPGVDGVTTMPASLRRSASLAPEQALCGDVGFGAPSLRSGLVYRGSRYRGMGPSVHSVATATERGNGGHPFGDSDSDNNIPALMPSPDDDDIPALVRNPDLDDDGASELTPLLVGRGDGGGGASAASASAASSSSHSAHLLDQATRLSQRVQREQREQRELQQQRHQQQQEQQEQQQQQQQRKVAKPKPPPPVLASFSREALEQRFCALLEYNASIAAVLPLVDFATAGQRGSLAHAVVASTVGGSSTLSVTPPPPHATVERLVCFPPRCFTSVVCF